MVIPLLVITVEHFIYIIEYYDKCSKLQPHTNLSEIYVYYLLDRLHIGHFSFINFYISFSLLQSSDYKHFGMNYQSAVYMDVFTLLKFQ